MKKLIYILMAVLLPLSLQAESFSSLWKKYHDAQEKDLPKTQMQVLRQIVKKAETEKAYGHLLKAQFALSAVNTQISPDSFAVEKERLVKKAEAAKDPALEAVYASALGKMFSTTGEDQQLADQWYNFSMRNVAELAKHKDAEFEPALVEGADSKIFYNDLLHVIGFEARQYDVLAAYYKAAGNRPAAAICDYYLLKDKYNYDGIVARKSKYLQRVDSLLKEYGDLKEGGLFAVEHYKFISRCEDVTVEDRINYINYALARWGAWPGCNRLRNAQSDLQQPSFNINVGDYMMLPNAIRQLRINSIRNISTLTLNVYRLNVKGNIELDPDDKDDYQKLQKVMLPTPVQTMQRRYVGLAPWQETSDSLSMEGLPVGVYLLEATTDNNNVDPRRTLLHVSNLFVMNEARPDDVIRFVVVNATTGAPVAGANLEVIWSKRWGKNEEMQTLKTDKNGVADCHYEHRRPDQVYAYTDDDKACDKFDIRTNMYLGRREDDRTHLSVFTDRSIYRPGQQVQASALLYSVDNNKLTAEALADKSVTFILRNANGKNIGQQTVSTDGYGTASATFTLPQSGLTGQFVVQARGEGTNAVQTISVEQYKRPTFEVEFESYKGEYHPGDTVTIRGKARSYSGVPVQSAKVSYSVVRAMSRWWAYWGGASEQLLTDTVKTDDDGSFLVRMPMELPANENTKRPGLYNIKVMAQVTDLAGENHSAETSLPLSLKSAFLTIDLPAKAQRDSLRSFTFSRKNVAGEPIDGQVRYRVDEGEWRTAQANKLVTIEKKLPSGTHLMEAICEGDTVQQRFVLFSLSDKKPAEQTHDWYYLSHTQFPADGKPVYLQVGSSDEETHIYYSIYAKNKLVDEGRKTLRGEVHTEKITYKETMGDGLVINMAWVHRGKLYTHVATITRPQPDKKMSLSWKTFRDKLVPGQKEEWTLQVLSPEGKPVEAQLMATLFDKSLNALRPHQWNFAVHFSNSLLNSRWSGGSYSTIGLYSFELFKLLTYNGLQFTTFDNDMFEFASPYSRIYFEHDKMLMATAVAPESAREMGSVMTADVVSEDEITGNASVKHLNAAKRVGKSSEPDDKVNPQSADAPQLRENLQETAFFFPTLTTDDKGVATIKFTLPESVTTWHFMGLAHNKAMDYGMLEADAVAQKTVMVQPNLPRFLRSSDKATISARISNTSEKAVSGTARLQLLDPETEKIVAEWSKNFSAEAQKTVVVTYDVDARQLGRQSKSQTLFVARIVAEGRGFSDGEQHYLPLLPSRELITTTLPFSQEGAGTKTIDLAKLFPTSDKQNRLTVEYTNHPAWLVIQAMPTLANPYEKDAVSLASAIYANTIGQLLLNSDPIVGRTIKLWQQEQGQETSLTSQLEKNQELKNLVLDETPWVAEAVKETEQKHLLAEFLDDNTIAYRLKTFSEKLKELQNANGSFSWWPGMEGNPYMTVSVAETLTRLGVMTGRQTYADMLDKAYKYLDKKIAEEVSMLKTYKKEDRSAPSEFACSYLYASALYGRKQTSDMKYLVDLLEKMPTALTIYGKAGSAIILAQYGRTVKAREYLQSLNEYAVYKDDMGRYYDTPRARYSWASYKIPTQVMAIEALKALSPDDTKTISDMQRWLLHEKRTTAWSTAIDATDAVYAFLTNAQGKVDMSKLTSGQLSTLKIDNQAIEMPEATAGLGYVKTAVQPAEGKTFTAEKTSAGTSWGALYAQSWQTSTDVDDAVAGLKVTREVIGVDGKTATALHVGDKVRVRITIEAERDYDFVQVEDKRAACLEPAEQLSGYRWGYYCAPQDNATRYYFNHMAKGKHVVETTYYVDREGQYTSGICTVQCAYSPEYSGRCAAKTLQVMP